MKTINIKENTLKLNELALKSTEKTVLKTINTVEDLQDFTSKSIKKTLQFSEKQQDNLFNTLEKGKKLIWKNANKTLGFFNKN